MIRVRAQRRRSDDGMSLIELLVAMGVSSILIALILTLFVSSARSFSDQTGVIDNSRLASTAMNEVTRIIRAGTEIPQTSNAANLKVLNYAGAEKIIMYSFIDSTSSTDPAPLKVQFARNAKNELVETRWDAYHVSTTYWAFNTTSTYARTIARSLLPANSTPLFSYFDKSGAALVPATGASLTAAQIANVASIQVTMQVQADRSGRVQPVTIQNLVGLPNLGVARVQVN